MGVDNTDAQDAGALSHNRNNIDIYSNSWGPPDDGYTVGGPGPRTRQAFMEGATEVTIMLTEPTINFNLSIRVVEV